MYKEEQLKNMGEVDQRKGVSLRVFDHSLWISVGKELAY